MSIDTFSTAGKIAVMQASVDGKTIEYSLKDTVWDSIESHQIGWHWDCVDYRVKPQTLAEAAMTKYTGAASFESYAQAYEEGAIFGAQWQKEEDL